MENTLAMSIKITDACNLWPNNNTLGDLPNRILHGDVQNVLIATGFQQQKIGREWLKINSSRGERLNNLWYLPTMEYYAAVKKEWGSYPGADL